MFNKWAIELTDFLREKSREFISTLSNIPQLQSVEALPVELNNILKNISDRITEAIDTISKDIEKITSKVQANTLNIGFFGETNAGKSTIIEALIEGEGTSIGTGIKDFTKDIVEYNLKLGGVEQSIKLIDMPGIEGKEDFFIEKIKEAVFKSHIVLYVTSASKEPERETLAKVREYLNKRAKVFIVLNKRMGVEAYEYKKVLIDENIRKVMERTEILVRKELGDFFSRKIIVIDAHLAFLARGKIDENSRFRKDKEKALSIFGSVDKILSFSGFNYLFNEMLKLSDPFTMNLEIIRTNYYKILGEMEKIIANILKNKKELDLRVRELISENDRVIREIINYWHSSSKQVLNAAHIEIDKVCNEVKDQLFRAIENNKEVSEREIKKKLDDSFVLIEQKTRERINEISAYIQQKLKIHSEKIEIMISISGKQKDLSINLGEILKDINMSLKDYLKIAFRSTLSIIVSAIFGGTTGIILGIIKAICGFFFGVKDEQIVEKKKIVDKKINDMRKKLEESIGKELKRALLRIDNRVAAIEKRVKLFDRSIRSVIYAIDSGIERLRNIRKDIIDYFLKKIFSFKHINVEFGYIDLSLGGALLVVSNSQGIDLSQVARMLNINEKKILVFSDKFQVLDFVHRAHIAESERELIFRFLNSFKDEFNIQKIIKDKVSKKIEIIFKNGGVYD